MKDEQFTMNIKDWINRKDCLNLLKFFKVCMTIESKNITFSGGLQDTKNSICEN